MMRDVAVLQFAVAVRTLADEARRAGLVVPGFRSPPRLTGADRTLRRRPGAPPAVAVRVTGRDFAAVAADLVEGVVVANGLRGPAARQARERLLGALLRDDRAAA
jgi:hypothetical protein